MSRSVIYVHCKAYPSSTYGATSPSRTWAMLLENTYLLSRISPEVGKGSGCNGRREMHGKRSVIIRTISLYKNFGSLKSGDPA